MAKRKRRWPCKLNPLVRWRAWWEAEMKRDWRIKEVEFTRLHLFVVFVGMAFYSIKNPKGMAKVAMLIQNNVDDL